MKPSIPHSIFLFVASIIFSSCTNNPNDDKRGTDENFSRYELVEDWPSLPTGYVLGQVTGVDVDTNQNIVLIHRAGREWKILDEIFPDTAISANTILVLDSKTGKPLHIWGANMFIMPHGLTVDKENNVWVTDCGLQQVLKYTIDGKLLMKIGEDRITGNDSTHFNYPTDVAVSGDGSFYVSDGYRNSRVVKFSNNGKYLFEWGKGGNGEAEFNTPHGIDLDSRGNVYVADRENNRIQKFDSKGNFLGQWKNNMAIQLYSLSVNPINDNVFAIDYINASDSVLKGSDIIVLDSAMKYLHRFGRTGLYKGPVCRYHDLTIDKEGSVYTGDILGNRIQKFRMVTGK